jgi:hypothetical protein
MLRPFSTPALEPPAQKPRFFLYVLMDEVIPSSAEHTAGLPYFDCSTRPIVMISASFVPS